MSSQTNRTNLWNVLLHLKDYETDANHKMKEAVAGRVLSYMKSTTQKQILEVKKSVAHVVKNYSDSTAKTFAKHLKLAYDRFYIE